MFAWLSVFLTFVLGPLQWISLADVGLALKPVHPPFFLAAGLGWLCFLQGQVSASLVRAVSPFMFLYSCYLLILLLSVLWGGNPTFVFKYTAYFLSAMGFMFLLSTYECERLMRLLFWSGLMASLVFVAVTAATLAANGINLFNVVGRALTTGDPKLLQFLIFRNLFGLGSGTLHGDHVSVALRHTSIGFVFVAFLLAAATVRLTRWSWLAMFVAFAIIFVSVSRSVTLAIVLALLPLTLSMFRHSITFIWFATLSLALVITVLPTIVDLSGAFQIVDQRFSSLGEDGRFAMFDTALGLIDNRAFFGYGAGYTHDYGGAIPVQVHNLFLGAWIQGGIICLMCAIGFTGFLVILYIKRLAYYISEPSKICLLGILVLPLFRSQVSGSGGAYTLPEWICIAIVLALFAASPENENVTKRRTIVE